MADVTLRGLNVRQTLAMAQGLLETGEVELAANLLALVRRSGGRTRPDVLVRDGIAASGPSFPRRGLMLDVLDALEPYRPTAFVADGLATWLKILPFYDDPRFVEIADRHRELLPSPNWHWNLQTALWCARRAARLEGDFVELGVFRGHTTLFLAEYLDFASWPRTWRLYDTFEGIPEDQLDPGWAEPNANVYVGAFTYEEVCARFAGFPNIRLIKGRVPEILVEDGPGPIAFLHVDLNNSTAEIAALDLLYERIVSGGVILFDDFCWMTARAQHDAEVRWFAERGLEILPLPTGQGLFVKP